MAKVTITLEDGPNNMVKTTMDPSFEIMGKMARSGETLTSAQAYALFAIRMIREESKRRSPTPILFPRLGKA